MELTGLHMKLDVTGGARIADVCREAQHIANVLNIDVEFEFNEVRCIAKPMGSSDYLQDEYHAIVSARSDGRDRWPGIASSVAARRITGADYGTTVTNDQ